MRSTDGIRGRTGHSEGLHVWELDWNTQMRGTHAVIGVATKDAPLHCVGYQSLVGSCGDSWGWDLTRKEVYHDVRNNPGLTYPSSEKFVVPNKVLMALDMHEGTLSFVVDEQYLGVAFRGLRGKKLYPIVSSVRGGCEITMKYLGGLGMYRNIVTLCLPLQSMKMEMDSIQGSTEMLW